MADEVPVHLYPIQIRIYADGFTAADRAACDASGYLDVKCGIAPNTMMHPMAVTCRTCIAHPLYGAALQAHKDSTAAPYPIAVVDRMAHRVYRRGGRYDVVENNRVREWLGLVTLHPSAELIEALIAEEDRIHQGYREDRLQVEKIRRYMVEHGISGEMVTITRTDVATGRSQTEHVINLNDMPALPKRPR